MKPDKISSNSRQIQAFITDSMNDYIAARVLLLSGLISQGAILGSTSIEKACKAILAFNKNESKGHLKKSHWNAVKNFDKKLWSQIRQDFLELNKKVYRLRYTDDLPIDFNIVIAQREYLAELDHTIIHLIHGFSVNDGSTKFTQLKKEEDPRFFQENHVLNGWMKNDFIYSMPQQIYEIRNVPRFGLVEMTYSSIKPAKKDNFMREGNKFHMEGATHNYDLSHYPLPPQNYG